MKNKIAKLLVLTLIFSIFSAFAPLQKEAVAASLQNVSDTLSDSDRSYPSTHTVRFTTGTTTPAAGGFFEVELNAAFSDFALGDITCPANTTANKPAPRIARCLVNTDRAPGAYTITIANVVNPTPVGPTSYLEYVRTYGADGTTILEKADIRVAIIDNVEVHAKVDATLVFTINNVPTSTVINGKATTLFGATSSLEFGTLVVDATSTLGQELRVTTNADDGYIVTVEQDHELLSNSGSNINSFANSQDNTGSTTPSAWIDPSSQLDVYNTYGHMALTSDDATMVGPENQYVGGLWAGLNSTDPKLVMQHDGPADGQTQNKGVAKVAYSIKVSALQEAGDYTNTLTYICTPTY